LLINPRALFQADFQLSYLAAFSIILFTPIISSAFARNLGNSDDDRGLKHQVNKFIIEGLHVVFVVQLVLIPVLLYYYHQFTLLGFITNLISVPITMCVIVLGILSLVAQFVLPFIAFPFFWITGFAAMILDRVATTAASLPGVLNYGSPMPWWAIGVYYLVLFSGSYMYGIHTPLGRLKGKAQFLISICCLVCLLVWLPVFGGNNGELRVWFLDVGQGDAIYIESPNRNNILIDAGRHSPTDIGEKVISPFLSARGVDNLDLVVATHPDADHIGGIPSVLGNFDVNLLLESGAHGDSQIYSQYKASIHSSGTTRLEVDRGDEILGFLPARVKVLHPSPHWKAGKDKNNASIVLWIELGDASFMFTGDVEEPVEKELVTQGFPLDSTVLKAGHHGSEKATSEVFLDSVVPLIVVFSCGKNNIYKHPHPSVVNRCKQKGIRIYRTDKNGCVSMATNGNYIRIFTEE
jgi:competence protein ComEC